jgi:hypothetical protein
VKSIARRVRAIVGMRPLRALALFELAHWFTNVTGLYRLPGAYLPFAVAVGVVLAGAALFLLVQRLMTARPPLSLQPVVDHADLLILLAIGNLMLINVLAPVFQVAPLFAGGLVLRNVLMLLGRASGGVLLGIFFVLIAGLVCALLVSVGTWLAARSRALSLTFRVLDRAVVAAILLFTVYGMALAFNGGLDTSAPVEHRTEVVRIAGAQAPWGFVPLSWVELRSWRTPGATERVLLFPARDGLAPGRVGPGLPLTVRVRSGFLNVSWVEALAVDPDRDLEELLRVVPTAGAPRQQLIRKLLAAGRWQEAALHTRTFLDQYPSALPFAGSVIGVLERAGQKDDARALERHARAVGRFPDTGPAVGGSPGAADPDGTVHDMMARLGLGAHLDEVAARIQSRLGNASRTRAEARAAGAIAVVDRNALREAASEVLARALARGDAEALRWLRSPQWQRMRALRAQAALDATSAREEFIAGLPDAPPSAARIALVHRLDRASAVSVLHVEVSELVERIVARGGARARGFRDRGQWLAAAESMRFRTATWTLYAYRDVSDPELLEYVTALETPAGRWLARVYRDAMLAALESALARVEAAALTGRTAS